MKETLFALVALVLSFSLWPASCALAAIDGTCHIDATQPSRGLIRDRLAMHDEDAEENGGHYYKHSKHKKGKSETEEEYEHQHFCGPYFKPEHVRYFRGYYSRDNYANLPPGLRKHIEKTGHLPPGLEKKYERTGQLPPGLQKRLDCGQTLPPDYTPYLYPVPDVAYKQVGPLPPDSRLYLYGNDLILLNDHTKAIIDILRGAY